ncbi:unnamed protein product [marine sediment metagenome]|uniref:ACT domain-containing protein n=1 Tax=marine sediment metagenome TaxID=412755 RepID=X1P2N1_9ZZZZ
MKKTGAWYSDIWNYFANNQKLIQELIQILHSNQISGATRLPIYTIKMAEADKEYSQKLPEHTKGLTIQISDGTAFRLATEPGRVAKAKRPYWTIAINTAYDETDLDLTNTILYFASSTANKTIEIFVKV